MHFLRIWFDASRNYCKKLYTPPKRQHRLLFQSLWIFFSRHSLYGKKGKIRVLCHYTVHFQPCSFGMNKQTIRRLFEYYSELCSYFYQRAIRHFKIRYNYCNVIRFAQNFECGINFAFCTLNCFKIHVQIHDVFEARVPCNKIILERNLGTLRNPEIL